MVVIYSNDHWLKENKYHLRNGTNVLFEHTYSRLNFEEYDEVFKAMEQYYDIDYKHKELTNRFGHCSFLQLSTGMKTFFNYIYFAQVVKRKPELWLEDKMLNDASKMGPNMQYYLFKYANYYEVPFHFLNYNMKLLTDRFKEKCGNPIIDYPAKDIVFNLDGEIIHGCVNFLEAYHTRIDTYDWRIIQ
jgi:hypothetical protein